MSAGYILEIGVDGVSSNALNQDISSGGSGLVIRKSAWYLKSKTYGQIAVGQNGTATYHVIDDADATNTRNFSDAQAATVQLHNYKIVVNGAYNGLKWSDLERGWNNQTPGQGDRKNIVRYDSPTFAGFAIAAAWGSDDLWDAALTYKADVGNFSVLAKVGYGESTDPSATKCGGPAPDFKCKWFGTGATIMHKPTGLYVYGGYGWQQIDTPTFAGDDTSTTWVIQPGIEKKFMPIGKTTIFGEFRHDDAGANPTPGGNLTPTLGASLDYWAGGVVQNIEPAAMDLYLVYRHGEGEYTDNTNTVNKLDAFDTVVGGALIQF